jgi:hypothetical protein
LCNEARVENAKDNNHTTYENDDISTIAVTAALALLAQSAHLQRISPNSGRFARNSSEDATFLFAGVHEQGRTITPILVRLCSVYLSLSFSPGRSREKD